MNGQSGLEQIINHINEIKSKIAAQLEADRKIKLMDDLKRRFNESYMKANSASASVDYKLALSEYKNAKTIIQNPVFENTNFPGTSMINFINDIILRLEPVVNKILLSEQQPKISSNSIKLKDDK